MGSRSVLLAGADERDLTKLAEYEAIGGYAQLPKARRMKPEKLIETLLARRTSAAAAAPASRWAARPR